MTIGVVVALVCAIAGVLAFGLSIWGGILLYSFSGTVATLFLAWRRYRCIEYHEARG